MNVPEIALERWRTDWQPISTAPRDGTWFVARSTQPGWRATRHVRFAHPDDRMPVTPGHEDAWPSVPTEWMPARTYVNLTAVLMAAHLPQEEPVPA